MSQSRKRQYQQSPPPVKEEQQEQEEETQSIGAGINSNQCFSSSNCANSNNTIGIIAGGGNGGDDINQLKLKMAAIEAKNQILEGKLANQELNARIHAMNEESILTNLKQENRALWTKLKEVEENAKTDCNCKKITDDFGKRLTALEAKHQQEIAGLKAINERYQLQQHQQPTAPMSNCVVVPECQQGTSNNSNKIQYVTSIMVPCHSANLTDRVNMQESSHSHGYGLRPLESRHRPQTTLALIPSPPPKGVAPNPVPFHSAEQEEIKRLCNPLRNGWNSNCKATMKITHDELSVHNSSPVDWGNIIARKGFLLSACRTYTFQKKSLARSNLYYYEITTTSALLFNEGRLCIGLSIGTIKTGSWIGCTPNTYALQDDKLNFCLISGDARFFEWPAGAIPIKPMLYGYGDVFGCGLVLSPDNKLAIFFTTNGTLMGKQFPIVHTASASSILYPSVQLNRNVTVEANFGQKPFQYNIDKCPGLVFQW